MDAAYQLLFLCCDYTQNMIHVDRPDPFGRQVDMFLQASALLRSRCPSEFICNLRFNRLHHLEAFWDDYTSGVLKKASNINILHST